MESTKLIEPISGLKHEFIVMAKEWYATGDDRHMAAVLDIHHYLEELSEQKDAATLPSNYVPQTTFWLVSGTRKLLGVSKLRHWLLPHLEKRGGHIGYEIRPSQRRKGYGTIILRLTLEKARKMGLKKVLVTCDAQNTASARIIEKNGGKLAEITLPEETGCPEKCYWINLS